MKETYDWTKIAQKVPTDGWMLLAKSERYTIAEALRQGKIKVMQGVKVRTRNTVREPGGRFCDIWLSRGSGEERGGDETASNNNAGGAADG